MLLGAAGGGRPVVRPLLPARPASRSTLACSSSSSASATPLTACDETLLQLGVARNASELRLVTGLCPGLLAAEAVAVRETLAWLAETVPRLAALAGECTPAGGCEVSLPALCRASPALLLASPAHLARRLAFLERHLDAPGPVCCRNAIVADAVLGWPAALCALDDPEAVLRRFSFLRAVLGVGAGISALSGDDEAFLRRYGGSTEAWEAHSVRFRRLRRAMRRWAENS